MTARLLDALRRSAPGVPRGVEEDSDAETAIIRGFKENLAKTEDARGLLR